ncbi:MAG TPA: hypothetical protein ENN12_03285 [Epsilonproteobacteria bacterium]|nr:hypothetical protein [Campylobacterota bacterium]
MHDVKVLEKEWRRYKMYQFMPWIALSVLILFLLLVGIWASYNGLSNEKKSPNSHLVLVSHDILEIATLEEKQTQEILPTEVLSKAEGEIEIKESLYAPDTPVPFPVEPLAEANEDSKPKEKITLDIHKTSAKDAIDDVKARFLEQKDPNDALFVAMTLYEQGDYASAHDWAVEVNKITQNIEDSWLVLAKSKAKLGRKKEAIDLLRAYAENSDSKNALELADKIKQGAY